MTTIAVNKEGIACDLQFTYNDNVKFKGKTKIYNLPQEVAQSCFDTNKALIGFSGNAEGIATCLAFLYDPDSFKRPPRVDCTMLLLTENKEIYVSSTLTNWLRIQEKHFAIGSGSVYALGALESGKTPLEACKIASKFDIRTGLGFKELKLK